jgi:hypothetical protein
VTQALLEEAAAEEEGPLASREIPMSMVAADA